MSQKRAKLIKKYIKALGMDDTGRALQIPAPGNSGRVVVLRDDKAIKRVYKSANWCEKTIVAREAMEVIDLANPKNAKQNDNSGPQTPTSGSEN